MNWLKQMIRKFTSRPTLREEWTLNRKHIYNPALKALIHTRQIRCAQEGIKLHVAFDMLDNDCCGTLKLLQGDEVIQSAKLTLGKNGLIQVQFDE